LCTGLAACGAQLKYLHTQYQPLPEPGGPLQGVAAYLRERRMSAVAAASHRSAAGHAAAPRENAQDHQQHYLAQEPSSTPRWWWQRQRDQPPPRPSRKNILFVGDSLVTGVGCDGDAGPTMPRACAEFLARHLHVDVKWAAIGQTGADVAELRGLLPAVGAAVTQAQEAGGQIDLVVVICGLNDYKYAYQGAGRTALGFKQTLSDFVAALHHETGVGCTVVLPALPVQHAPVFSGDMPVSVGCRMLLAHVGSRWDAQKEALARSAGRISGRISFVENKDENGENWSAERYWARDRIHPSNLGYTVWGEHIAECIMHQGLMGGSASQLS